nr:hypothetical protein [Tanacetum cinerariifolium]
YCELCLAGNGYVKSGQNQSKTDKTGHENEKNSRNRSLRQIHLNSNPVNPLTLKNPKQLHRKARTPESPHIVAPPTCHVEESEDSGTSDARSTLSYSTALLSPDHPLTHTTLVFVLILRRTVRMVVRVSPVMSPSVSAGMAKVAAMSDLAFRKRFRFFYDSSPSPTLPVRKRYRGADIARIARKEPKADKNRHENEKSTQEPGIYQQKSSKVNPGQLL